MIEIEKIRFKNLNSVGNYFVEIPLNLYKNLALVGKNGEGKSSIIHAITFALFGKPFTSVKIGSLINSINKKNLVTEIYFKKGKNFYKVIRGLKPDIFEIYKNDILLTKDAAKNDYQRKLDYILGFDFKSFTNVIILAAATNVPFMQLSTKERREIIERLLDLEVFSYMNDFAKKELKDVKEKISENENVNYKIELNLSNKEKFKTEILSSINSNISEHLDKIKEIQIEIDNFQKIKDKYIDKLKTVRKDKYLTAFDDLEKTLKTVDIGISTNNVINKESDKKIQFLERNDICPTCKQSLTSDYKEDIKKHIEYVDNSTLEATRGDIVNKIEKVKEGLKKIEKIENEINSLDSHILNFKSEINFHNKEIEKLNEKSKIDYDSDINNIKEELKNALEAKESLREQKSIIDVSLMLLKDDGIKASIIKKYVNVINKLINYYLEKFDFFVKFELNENFEESFKSRHVDDFTYENFSEGEKKRIDLAILFSLKEISKRKNLISCNLLAFDETMERIDENAADCFVKLLRNSDTNNIIISHDDKIISKFTSSDDCVIRAYKKGKFSYYEKL